MMLYGNYIFAAYFIVLLVFIINMLQPMIYRRKIFKELKQEKQ